MYIYVSTDIVIKILNSFIILQTLGIRAISHFIHVINRYYKRDICKRFFCLMK